MSSLEDRLKQFLPAIAKANIELQEKIELQGKEIVQIDNNLDEDCSDDDEEENEENASEQESDSEVEEGDNKISAKTDGEVKQSKRRKASPKDISTKISSTSTPQQISLEFMLGEVEMKYLKLWKPQTRKKLNYNLGYLFRQNMQ